MNARDTTAVYIRKPSIPQRALSIVRMCLLLRNWTSYMHDLFLSDTEHKTILFYLKNGIQLTLYANQRQSQIITENWIDRVYLPVWMQHERIVTIVDIGAHVGVFSIWAATTFPKSHVYAFEPMHETYGLLQRNVSSNILPNISTYPMAVSGRTGTIKFYELPKNTAGSSIIRSVYTKSVKPIAVRALSLQALFSRLHITTLDLLKMDCEGAEFEILEHAPRAVLARIRHISMEYHQLNSTKVNRLVALLEKHRYQITLQPINEVIGYLYATRP